MAQNVRCRRCWSMFDPDELNGVCPICLATDDDFVKSGPRKRRVGAVFARLSSYSAIVARLQWDALTIDLTADTGAWRDLPAERRRKLTTLLCSFCVAEDSVAEHLDPFARATPDTLVAWVFFLQKRDEQRHTQFFDRVADEVLCLPGDTPDERRRAAREHVPEPLLELFEVRLPEMAAELAAGRMSMVEAISLYHMLLEGIVFSAGQKAVLQELESDRVLPGVYAGMEHVDLDERWHIGFGLRNLVEAQPEVEVLRDLLGRARGAADAWGDAVPAEIRDFVAGLCHRRLVIAGLIDEAQVAAA